MHFQDYFAGSTNFPFSLGVTGGILFAVLMIWSLIWKGLALWRAARKCNTVWFVLLLLVNTVGILDIIYYYFVAKDSKSVDCK